MKWFKRIFVAALLLVVVAVGLFVTANLLRHKRPDWYPAGAPDAAAIRAAAQSMQHKFRGVQSWAAESNAQERTRLSGREPVATDPDTPPEKAKTVTLTDAELNAFFSDWDKELHWSNRYNNYVSDPVLVLKDRRIILAGTVKDLDTVVSVHLEPRLDDQGKLRLQLVKVMGGSLPLPRAFWSGYLQKLTGLLDRKIDEERPRATMTADGAANDAAVAAGMNELLVHALNNEPAEPVLFLPQDIAHQGKHGKGLPVRLTEVDVTDNTLTLTVVPLTPAERQELLKHLREPQPARPAAAVAPVGAAVADGPRSPPPARPE